MQREQNLNAVFQAPVTHITIAVRVYRTHHTHCLCTLPDILRALSPELRNLIVYVVVWDNIPCVQMNATRWQDLELELSKFSMRKVGAVSLRFRRDFLEEYFGECNESVESMKGIFRDNMSVSSYAMLD